MRRTKKNPIEALLGYFSVIVFVLSILGCKDETPAPLPVTDPYASKIDPSITYQVIKGYGGATVFLPTSPLSSADLDLLFGTGDKQIGLSILRIRIASDDDPNWRALELSNAKGAKVRGASVIASPWSPPARMKTNNSLIGGSLKIDSSANYANYLNKFAAYMTTNGAELYALSIQNEPDIQVNYESCDWTSTQMRDFLMNYGSLISNTKVIAPESFNFNHTYTNVILDDANAAANVDIIGGHIYGSGLADYSKARDKGKELWMTEHLDTAIRYSQVLATGKEIHDCMTVGQYNAYVWWYLKRFYGPLGENGVVTKRGWVMANFAKFIRPGYTRVFSSGSPRPGIYVSAYSGDKLVIVAINMGSSDTKQSFELKNTTFTNVIPYTTSETLNLSASAPITVTDNKFEFSLPAQSITSFVLN